MKISRPSRLPKVYLTMKQFIVISVVIVYFTVLWMVRYTVVPVPQILVRLLLTSWIAGRERSG